MNANIQQKIQDLVDALRTESDHNTTAFRLFVNCESHIHEVETRTYADLKATGTSMRNLRREWIGQNTKLKDEA